MILVISAMLNVGGSGSEEIHKLENWTFKNASGISSEINMTSSISDQFAAGFHKIVGSYSVEIPINNSNEEIAVYFGGIGGNYRIYLNGKPLEPLYSHYQSVGPVVFLDLKQGSINTLQIDVEVYPGIFSGIWREVWIGNLAEVVLYREQEILRRRTIPIFFSLSMMLSSLFFIWVFFQTSKTMKTYKYFSLCLILWSLFFLSLSGVLREWSFYLGSILHFPTRIAAGLGVYLLIVSYRNVSLPDQKKEIALNFMVGLVFLFGFFTEVFLGFYGASKIQHIVLVACTPFSFVPLLFWKKRDISNRWGSISYTFAITAFLGQSSDALKLLFNIYYGFYPLPFFNTTVFPLLLVLSVPLFAIQFTDLFRRIQQHVRRLEIFNDLSLRMMGVAIDSNYIASLIVEVSKAAHVSRGSFSRKIDERRYQVVFASGAEAGAIAETFVIDDEEFIASCIKSGRPTKASRQQVNLSRYKTGVSYCIPIPFDCSPINLAIDNPNILRLMYHLGVWDEEESFHRRANHRCA